MHHAIHGGFMTVWKVHMHHAMHGENSGKKRYALFFIGRKKGIRVYVFVNFFSLKIFFYENVH
jgi:hypothetical protein